MASELAGLLSAPRSMNVRCKEPEKWTLETPACLTKNLRTCAASALSAVEPAREACGFERPARRPLRASSTSRTRKPRPPGASMPCAPGWLVRSVVGHGGRADERAAMRTQVSCKENYAAYVKKITPLVPDLPIGAPDSSALDSMLVGDASDAGSIPGLTEKSDWNIIIFTQTSSNAQETAARPQVPVPSATRLLESSFRRGHRRTVPEPRVFRSPRPCSGQVRNAAPSRNRGSAGEPVSRRLWVLPTVLLPGAGEFSTGRPAGVDAPEARSQESSQAYRRGARIYPPSPSARSLVTLGGSGFAYPGTLWHRGSSTQHRTRFGARSKKTAVNEALPPPTAGQDWVARYEQLRKDALSQGTGGSFGLVLFLRQGMTAWMRASACAVTPAPTPAGKSVQPFNAVSPLPGDVRSQAAVILAGILLHHLTEGALCKATCTK